MIRDDKALHEKMRAILGKIQSARGPEAVRKAREARDNTRIEELAEALENLAIAISSMAMTKVDPDRAIPQMVKDFLKEARAGLREALREFLAPNLHLVEGVRQPQPPDDPVRCGKCKSVTICSNPICPDWAAAVKKETETPLERA
jgi:hypothetical protein